MTAYGWRKRQIMQWIPSEKKDRIDKFLQGEDYRVMYLKVRDELAELQQRTEQKPVVFFRTDNGWRKEEFEKTLVKKVPLDTTPPEPKPHVWFDFSNVPLDAAPPQRKWVGLTDEEKESFWRADQMTQKEWGELFTAIESKLKEKNGG